MRSFFQKLAEKGLLKVTGLIFFTFPWLIDALGT